MDDTEQNLSADDIIFATKFPHPGSHKMHKAHQFMLVIMTVQMEFLTHNIQATYKPNLTYECTLQFDAKLGYSDDVEPKIGSDWKLMTIIKNQIRPLTCAFSQLSKHGGDLDGYYTCEDQHLFELGSVAHKNYIINMRFPGVNTNKYCLAGLRNYFSDLHFAEIHQNPGYTISLFVAKTAVFPFIVAALLFFVRRIKREQREMILLEKSVMWLGTALGIMLLPIDWLTLTFDMPYMLFFSDLRQGLFYTALLIFWCIFAGEHILDQQERNQIASYKYEIGCISVGCLSLFIFDTVERGVQLANPFHTIWKKDAGEKVAKAFLGLAAGASVIYCLFFMRLLYRVYQNMKIKEVALPAMQEDRRIYYESRIYRFRVLLWVTLLTVVATVLCFVLDQVNETSWKFEDNAINDYVIVSSAMHFGMFGMWGTYVFAVMVLYSPAGSNMTERNVQYRHSEHLLRSEQDSVDASIADDEVSFRHPKT